MKDNPSISHIIIAVKVLLLLLGCCSCYKVSYNNINSNTKSYSKSKTMNSNTMNSNSYNDIIAKRKNIVDTFPANSFHPKGLFSTNCHYQTIVGSGTLKSILLGDKQRHFNPIAERIETPDGDFFDIEMVGDYEKAKAIVVLIHGLEGSMKGNQITTLTEAMLEKGFACCLFSFRGCNGEPQRKAGAYHLGFTTDINQLTDILQKRYPNKAKYLAGFSLGANVALKFLGELGDQAPERNIFGAAVACCPFDPVGSQGKLDVGFNKAVYSNNFLKTLKVKAEKEHERFPGAFDIEAIRKVTEIGDFDDLYIAKIFGFTDKVDYYRKTGSKWWIPMIRVPAIAINARDDPFIRESSLPTADDIGPTAPVRTIYHEYGGHGGFSFEDKDSYVHYGPANPDEKLSDNEQQFQIPSYGWLAHEMARVIDHIHYHSFLMYSNLKEQSNAATENSKGGYFPASATELIRSGNANNSI